MTEDKADLREADSGDSKDPGILNVSVFGGAIAALCCLLVPLLVLVGSTSVAVSVGDAFSSLRPYLIAGAWVLAILAAAYAIWRQVRRRPAQGCDAGDPEQSGTDPKGAQPES